MALHAVYKVLKQSVRSCSLAYHWPSTAGIIVSAPAHEIFDWHVILIKMSENLLSRFS